MHCSSAALDQWSVCDSTPSSPGVGPLALRPQGSTCQCQGQALPRASILNSQGTDHSPSHSSVLGTSQRGQCGFMSRAPPALSAPLLTVRLSPATSSKCSGAFGPMESALKRKRSCQNLL